MSGADSAAGVTVAAPAKLNLYLHILGRRDGYHILDSLIAFADCCDLVTASPGDKLGLRVKGPFGEALDGDDDNLVLRAARGLADMAGLAPRARLVLNKRLPVAAGIGGGSADAAAALRALCTLWDVQPDTDQLQALALSLGADVPVCLDGRARFVGGVGEDLEPAPTLPAAGLVLVNPGQPLSTPEVFGARAGAFSSGGRFETAPTDAAALCALLEKRDNDLTEAAIRLVPAITDVLSELAATKDCLLARMSGSGATCFGIYQGSARARSAAERLSKRRPEWWVATGRLHDDCREIAGV